jgi:NitT/TauT family transport system substrate-binding protein
MPDTFDKTAQLGLGARCGHPNTSQVPAVHAGGAVPAKPATAASIRHGRRPWRRVLAATVVAGIAVAGAACGSSSGSAGASGSGSPGAPEKPDIVVATVPAEANAGLYIAQAKGLFTKVGLHVTIQTVRSAQAVIPAMLHGTVDVDSGGYVTFILAGAKGEAKMRVLAPGFSLGPHVNEVVVMPHSSIRSPAGLKGKTIAVNQVGGLSSDLLFTALAPYGITPSQVHPVQLAFPDMPGALAAGKVDAAYITEPFVTEAVKKYGVQQVTDIDFGATQDFPLTGYAALASWVAKYPRTAAAFTKAIKQANAIAATNLAVLQTVLAKSLHISTNITGVMANGTYPTTITPVQLQRNAAMMRQFGQLKGPYDVKQLLGG